MALIASQKSGALAPASEAVLGDAVEDAAGMAGGERAHEDRPADGDHHRHRGEPERDRDRLEHDLERRPVLADRVAEVALGEPDEEIAELHDERLVEAVALVELLALLDRGVDRQIEVGRAAGQPGEEEDEDDQPDQGEQAVQRAADDEGAHRPDPPLSGACAGQLNRIVASWISLLVEIVGRKFTRGLTRV